MSVAPALLLLAACNHEPTLPTFRVSAGMFTRRITAEGNLKAVKASGWEKGGTKS